MIVSPTISEDCSFDVFIDGIKQTPKESELYRFEVDDIFHGAKKIKLVVHSGSIQIELGDSIGRYPLYALGNWSTIDIQQKVYVNWFHSEKFNLPIDLSAGDVIEYNHIVPNGATYIEAHIDYPMIQISRDIDKSAMTVIENL